MEILLNELQRIQKERGMIPEDEIKRIAHEQNISDSHLYGIISFYSRLYTTLQGKYVVRLCKSISCSINDGNKIITPIVKFIEEHSPLKKDANLFTFELIECLGYCSEGPVMTINDEVYTQITPENGIALLNELLKDEVE